MDKYLNPEGKNHKLSFNILKSHLRLNTIENRHHMGSIDALEMLNWIQFNLLFIWKCLNNTLDLDTNMIDPKMKEKILWQFIDDKELEIYFQNKQIVDDINILHSINQDIKSLNSKQQEPNSLLSRFFALFP